MKTKLVYVLTCAPEATYIEQALMSVYSARYWNKDAHIVLMVDDKTDALLTGKRGNILNYISEKIVVPFEDETLTPMYRSRWIKTQVRELVKGDLLFVDSDTVCCRSISEIDDFTCEVGAAGDNNTVFKNDVGRKGTIQQASPVCDLTNEEYYFSSGVIYCKDTERTHKLFSLWHQYWKDGVEKGIKIDQPALAKANIEMEHIIEPIDNVYNNVLYTQNADLYRSAIMHIPNYQQTTILFRPESLQIIREQGMTPWLEEAIIRIHDTYLPYDYAIKHSTIGQRIRWIKGVAYAAKLQKERLRVSYDAWDMRAGIGKFVKKLFNCRLYRVGAFLWMEYQRMRLARKTDLRPNICSLEE